MSDGRAVLVHDEGAIAGTAAAQETLMKAAICAVACLAVAIPSSALCAATRVSFAHPENYTDANLYGDYGTRSWQPAVDAIGAYLKRLGDRYLDRRQLLTIDVVDIDLAGYIDPLRPNAYNIRILRDGTWPRIKVRYSLAQDGRTVRRGEETIASIDYLTNASARFSSDPLRYEKAMLAEWFRTRFVGTGQ